MKYPKPKHLSDPFRDWQGCEDQLLAILQKEDADLNRDDFGVIYFSCLPAANYEEGAYYIEKCTNYIATGRDVRDSRLPDGFLRWMVTFQEQLVADGLFDQAKALVVDSLWHLLDQFELYDLTEEECAKHGMDFAYSVGPYNHQTVHDFFDEMTNFDEFDAELNGIVRKLTTSYETAHIRWYIDIAAHTRIWLILYSPPSSLEDWDRKEALFHRLHSFRIYSVKGESAFRTTRAEGKDKYIHTVSVL